MYVQNMCCISLYRCTLCVFGCSCTVGGHPLWCSEPAGVAVIQEDPIVNAITCEVGGGGGGRAEGEILYVRAKQNIYEYIRATI